MTSPTSATANSSSVGAGPASFGPATILGYPRIGPNRELKRAVEALWAGRADVEAVEETGRVLRLATARRLVELGLDPDSGALPGSFSFYDQMLDAAVTLGALPTRFADLAGSDGSVDLPGYFTIARGHGPLAPLEMTKWFDTNYHYLVPELSQRTDFHLAGRRIVDEFIEAKAAGFVTRPVIVGPITFLALSKAADDAEAGFRPLDRLADAVEAYAALLGALAEAGAPWVQLDEPVLVTDSAAASPAELAAAVGLAYRRLGGLAIGSQRPAILVTAPYGSLGQQLGPLAAAPIEAIAIDLVKGAMPTGPVPGLESKILVGGVIDGHNIWRADLDRQLDQLRALGQSAGVGAIAVGTSTSLLHVPHTVADEVELPAPLTSWLAFADEKVSEVVALADALGSGQADDAFGASRAAVASRPTAPGVVVPEIRSRVAALGEAEVTRAPAAQRRAIQAARLSLPALPTTTIGSFPQTAEIRAARAANAKGDLSDAAYTEAMRAEVTHVIALQEELGLDVLVHGEPERNDMVQYFAELLDGFAATRNGWVQSYGSRCVRPPILWGDVSRPAPMTVEWSAFAQSLTTKPVKGMLTGPVTILAWSFVRDDQSLGDTAAQVALALRDEIADLEAADIGVVQVDEPALRELLPLRQGDQEAYLAWAVRAFRIATSGAATQTQVHTHLCYSEFGEVIGAIDALGADVTSLEAARSRMEIVPELAAQGYSRGIGPGVYDIHSPRIPSVEEVAGLLRLATGAIDPAQLWVNPDCGLKTRGYPEVLPSLANLVEATAIVRAELAG